MTKNLVIGLGISGKAICKYLENQGQEVIAVDRKDHSDNSEIHPFDFDRVIVSPGISKGHILYKQALVNKIPITSESEIALGLMTKKAVGITGTNGKSTLCYMVEHILNTFGISAKAVGNCGDPIIESIDASIDVFILEISSFQLETMVSKKLDVAVITNIDEDHLDRHGSLREYTAAKCRIKNLLKPTGVLYDRCCETMREYAQNICSNFNITQDQCVQALQSFNGLEHRLEFVKDIGGIAYYNDSKGTNVSSVIYAVNTLQKPLVLIVGGKNKGSSFEDWIKPFKNKVRKVIAYGEAREEIHDQLSSQHTVIIEKDFTKAFQIAKNHAQLGDIVLLSPGCASFDQFDNFEDRGHYFKKLVRGDV